MARFEIPLTGRSYGHFERVSNMVHYARHLRMDMQNSFLDRLIDRRIAVLDQLRTVDHGFEDPRILESHRRVQQVAC